MKLGICCSLPSADVGAERVAAHHDFQRGDAAAGSFLQSVCEITPLRLSAMLQRTCACSSEGNWLMSRSTVEWALWCASVPKTSVAGLGGFERDAHRFEVAHFADQHDVRVFAQGGAQRALETVGVRMNFALVDEAFLFGCTNSIGSSMVMMWSRGKH